MSTAMQERARAGTNTSLPVIAAAITMILWASAFIAIRTVGVHYSPGAMALGRLAVGALALSVVANLRNVRVPRGRPLLLVIAYGCSGSASTRS